jgi:hypothetical protein
MTTNLHDKMLAAIDAYFSASDGTEEEVAENLLLDVRDEINKQKYVPETNFGNMAEPKIGCVNHDCDKCKAVQEPAFYRHEDGHLMTPDRAKFLGLDLDDLQALYTTPPAPQPVPVKTYHDFELLPVAPVPNGPYSAPIKELWPVAPKPWMGLTEEERSTIESEVLMRGENYPEVLAAIEAKLRERNGGAA